VTSRICTTNNCFKRSEKKLCFSENFCWQTKNIHNFFGDNTRFTLGIEAWSPAAGKIGFRMDTKNFNSERKRVWPHTDPRSQRLVVQINPKVITGVETPSNLIYIVLKGCIERVEYHLAQWFLHSFLKTKYARSIRTKCERHSNLEKVCSSFGWETFPKLLVLLDKMHTGL